MSIQLKLRRGTTAQHSTFTGASGEVTVDTTKKTLVVHDGATAGGVPLVPSTDVSTSGGASKILKTDASGNVGLGVTPSASSLPTIEQSVGLFVGRNEMDITSNAYYNGGWKYVGTGAATQYQANGGLHKWLTAPSGTAGNAISFTQAMTLDASGNLLVGTTSQPGGPAAKLVSVTTGTSSAGMFVTDTAGWQSIACWNKATSGTIYLIEFGTGASYAARGSITYNGTSVAYNTTSDYRLKENVKPMSGALAKVAALKPVTYTWKADGSEGEGFIAHELQEVCPNAVAGEKDAIDTEGNPKYQGIDTSFLVATLTAAIQEQQALITQLKARLDAANL